MPLPNDLATAGDVRDAEASDSANNAPEGAGASASASDERATTPCPYCRELIIVGARKCHYCGEFLDTDIRHERPGTRHDTKFGAFLRQSMRRGIEEAPEHIIVNAYSDANFALALSVLAFVLCGLLIGPFAIGCGREANRVLHRYGRSSSAASAAVIIGWVAIVFHAVVIIAYVF